MLTSAIGQSESKMSEAIKQSEANLHVELGLLRQEQTRISADVKSLADQHDELASSTNQRLTVIENVISSNPSSLPPGLSATSNHYEPPSLLSVCGAQPPFTRLDPRRPVSPYDTVTAALERLSDSLRSNITSPSIMQLLILLVDQYLALNDNELWPAFSDLVGVMPM